MSRRTSQRGIEFLKRWEGVRNVVYLDAVNLPTVGVGHLIKPGDPWKVGDRISDEEVDRLLRQDLATAEGAVERLVKVPIDDDQFAALVSLTFNIGTGAFGRSSLLKRLNAGDYDGAADRFLDWKKAGGRVIKGLVRRRAAEVELFCGPDDDPRPARPDEPAPASPPEVLATDTPEAGTTTVTVDSAGEVNVAAPEVAPTPQPTVAAAVGSQEVVAQEVKRVTKGSGSWIRTTLTWIGGLFTTASGYTQQAFGLTPEIQKILLWAILIGGALFLILKALAEYQMRRDGARPDLMDVK